MKIIKVRNTEIQSFEGYFLIKDRERRKYLLQIIMSIFFYLFALYGVYFVKVEWFFILWGVAAVLQFIFLMKKDVSVRIEKKNIRHIVVKKSILDQKIISVFHPKKRKLEPMNEIECNEIICFLMNNKI